MSSSGMGHHVAFIGTDVSEKRIAMIIRLERMNGTGTTLVVTSNKHTAKYHDF
jgi:hypothetical protein